MNIFRFLPGILRNKIEGRDELKKITVNFSWLFADKMVRLLLGLLVNVLLARYLGPDQFGLWNYGIAFVTIFSPIANLGLNNILVRDLVTTPEQKDTLIGSAFVLKLVGGLVATIAAVVVMVFLRPGEDTILFIVALTSSAYIMQSFDSIDLFFQSQYKSKFTVIAKNVGFVSTSLVKILMVYLKADLMVFVWLSLLEIAIGSVFLIVAYKANKHQLRKWRYHAQTAKRLVKDSWPLILSGFSIYTQAYIDQVMLGDMVSDAEVAQYSVAMKLVSMFAFIPMIIQSSVAPEITRAKQISEDLYYMKLKMVYQIMFIVFLAIAVPIFFFSENIIIILYGHEYEAAGYLLSLFAIRLLFTNFGTAKGLFITNDNLFRYALIVAATGAIANISANLILIPLFASKGALYASIISFGITTFVIDALYFKTRRNFKAMMLAMFDFKSYLKLIKKG